MYYYWSDSIEWITIQKDVLSKEQYFQCTYEKDANNPPKFLNAKWVHRLMTDILVVSWQAIKTL